MKLPLILFALLFANIAFSQKLNTNWSTELNAVLTEFKSCSSNCRPYLPKALKTVYPTVDEDFVSESTKKPMRSNELITYMKETGKWIELGSATDQATLDKAAANAAEGKATIAVLEKPDGGAHISIIIPGKLTPSGSWGVKTPNTASLFMYKPVNSHMDKPLSYCYSPGDRTFVKIYVFNY